MKEYSDTIGQPCSVNVRFDIFQHTSKFVPLIRGTNVASISSIAAGWKNLLDMLAI
jgi:hypothetical protein